MAGMSPVPLCCPAERPPDAAANREMRPGGGESTDACPPAGSPCGFQRRKRELPKTRAAITRNDCKVLRYKSLLVPSCEAAIRAVMRAACARALRRAGIRSESVTPFSRGPSGRDAGCSTPSRSPNPPVPSQPTSLLVGLYWPSFSSNMTVNCLALAIRRTRETRIGRLPLHSTCPASRLNGSFGCLERSINTSFVVLGTGRIPTRRCRGPRCHSAEPTPTARRHPVVPS